MRGEVGEAESWLLLFLVGSEKIHKMEAGAQFYLSHHKAACPWRSISLSLSLSLSLSPHRLRVLGRHAHSPLRNVQQAPVHVLEFDDLILEALLVG